MIVACASNEPLRLLVRSVSIARVVLPHETPLPHAPATQPRMWLPGTAHVFVGGVPWRANADDLQRFLGPV